MAFAKLLSAAAVAAIMLSPIAASAQETRATGPASVTDPLILAAERSGVCGEFGVATAVLNDANQISAVCNDDAVAFLPLLGGQALAGLLGLTAVLAGAGGGSPTGATGGTSGTN